MTKVVHIRETPKGGFKDNPDYVYIGRPGKGMTGIFGNPFSLPTCANAEQEKILRQEILEKYEAWLVERMKAEPGFEKAVKGLKGKILVCFCAPKACHGHVLAKYAELS